MNITEEIEQQNKDVGSFVLLCDNNVIENRDQESYHLMDDECIQGDSVKTGNLFGGATGRVPEVQTHGPWVHLAQLRSE